MVNIIIILPWSGGKNAFHMTFYIIFMLSRTILIVSRASRRAFLLHRGDNFVHIARLCGISVPASSGR